MFSQKRRRFVAAALLAPCAVASVAFAQRLIAAPVLADSAATIAQDAPVDFSLHSIDGQTISSSTVRGQVVVLAFGASWLPLSRKQAQGVRKLADEYSKHGVVVYFVSTDSDSPKSKNYASDEQIRAFARRNDLNITVLRDPEGQVSKRLGVDQLPAFVILDKSGNMSGSPIGGFDPNSSLVDQLAPRLDKIM
ncbi:MAG: peroxiredoxin family protein [Pyrinomonadaceae bacterium]